MLFDRWVAAREPLQQEAQQLVDAVEALEARLRERATTGPMADELRARADELQRRIDALEQQVERTPMRRLPNLWPLHVAVLHFNETLRRAA